MKYTIFSTRWAPKALGPVFPNQNWGWLHPYLFSSELFWILSSDGYRHQFRDYLFFRRLPAPVPRLSLLLFPFSFVSPASSAMILTPTITNSHVLTSQNGATFSTPPRWRLAHHKALDGSCNIPMHRKEFPTLVCLQPPWINAIFRDNGLAGDKLSRSVWYSTPHTSVAERDWKLTRFQNNRRHSQVVTLIFSLPKDSCSIQKTFVKQTYWKYTIKTISKLKPKNCVKKKL